MRLTVDEVEGLQEIRESVKAIADKAVPFARIELIGSHSIDLATPTSDMDFRLSLPMYEKDPFERGPSPGRPRARKAAMQQLKSLCQAFAASDAFTDATVLNAIVPIVKAVHVRTNIAIEIQVSSSEIPQQLYKKTYLAEYPTLRPLYILLRSALETRCLGTVFEGGLGSYTIFIMIVYALKTCPPNIDRTDVGGQLLYLLDFYANANLTKEGFSLDPPSAFPKLLKGQRRARIEGRSDAVSRGIQRIGNTDPLMPHRLCLQDPADPQNDLGRKSYCIMDVQKLFRYALKGILRNRQGANTESNRPGVLFPLVGANYDDFQRKRASLPGFRVLRVPGVSKTRPKDWI
jgi:non-canonical poly(A) RNA polymerase PAPD5/7